MDDVYEPLARYRDEFRERFATEAEKAFDDLVERSGVNAAENKALADEVRRLDAALKHARSRRSWRIAYIVLAAVALALCVGWGALSLSEVSADFGGGALALAGAAAFALALFLLAIPAFRRSDAEAKAAAARLEAKTSEAWEQMAPLNRLYDWDIVPKLVEKVVPRIAFDPYFTESRLSQLRGSFGWDDAFNDGKSVVFSQSGEINGNPFVFGDALEMRWGTRAYSGSRTVSWTELERDPEGRLRNVTRYQTLTATVTKPFPEYSRDRFLVYGNDAAPNLVFHREPSPLSARGDGFFARRALKREIRRLERHSRNLDDDSNYTIMGNREFEALFHAVDRSDEVEFRLLYTPLAQIQTLALLRDREVGYGDDFSFIKSRKVNLLRPSHLNEADLDANPSKFASYDLEAARAFFTAFCRRYFKDAYFALAPLLAIPLYQQTRTHENIHGGGAGYASFWEHEAIANFYGEGRFRHPRSATRNILKTHVASREDGFSELEVTAYGHQVVKRTDVVSVMARNGRYYSVTVPWDEYQPVSRTTPIRITEREGLSRTGYDEGAALPSEEWREFFRALGASPSAARFRRSIVSG